MSDIRGNLPLKVAACFLVVILSLVAFLSIAVFFIADSEGYYEKDPLSYQDLESVKDSAKVLCYNLLYDPDYVRYLSEGNFNQSITLTSSTGEVVRQYDSVEDPVCTYQFQFRLSEEDAANAELPADTYQATMSIGREQDVDGPFYRLFLMYETIYPIRNLLVPAATLSVLLGLISLVYLLCAAGHRRGSKELVPNVQDRIPLDLYFLGDVFLIFGLMTFLEGLYFYGGYDVLPMRIFLGCLTFCGFAVVILAALLTIATRLKLGQFWRNTVIWYILSGCGRFCRGVCRRTGEFFHLFPMTWRAVVLVGAFLFMDAFLIAATLLSYDAQGFIFLLAFVLNLAAIVVVTYFTWQLQVLKKAGQALAEGHLETKVDTRHLFFDLKRHGEHLNAIGDGMNRAVDQRMRSERLKTELITNVSHDIKTPLTSIINYVDLLKKEDLPESADDYLTVLDRQSQRLKKLTEDLVEASKASTGNMKVELQPIVVNEIIRQAIGDYDQRLAAGNLEVLASASDDPVYARADGRLLWRVLDNLLSNICKYAMVGSRVYIDLRTRGKQVEISVKNISRDPLNISPEELMERFVRGDASRHTEGSGLGLNIAKSLMELMGGTFDIQVDGDLFKAVLTLNAASAPPVYSAVPTENS